MSEGTFELRWHLPTPTVCIEFHHFVATSKPNFIHTAYSKCFQGCWCIIYITSHNIGNSKSYQVYLYIIYIITHISHSKCFQCCLFTIYTYINIYNINISNCFQGCLYNIYIYMSNSKRFQVCLGLYTICHYSNIFVIQRAVKFIYMQYLLHTYH